MAIIAKQNNETLSYEPIPEGVHLAVCYAVIDLGLQYSEKFDKYSRQIAIIWEIPGERIETEDGDKPKVLSKIFTNSLGEKANLKKCLEAWRGKKFGEEELQGFDLVNILKKGCQLQVLHTERNGKVYTNIASFMALPKGTKTPEPENKIMYFDLSAEDSTLEEIKAEMAKLPEWIQNLIKESQTYKDLIAPPVMVNQSDFISVAD
jgi:hypothetical protein